MSEYSGNDPSERRSRLEEDASIPPRDTLFRKNGFSELKLLDLDDCECEP